MATIEWLSEEDKMNERKVNKRKELGEICKQKIEAGFDCPVGNVIYHFSYDITNQTNFNNTMRLFDNNMIESINWNGYIDNVKERVLLTKESFNQVYLAGVKHKTDILARYNDTLLPLIELAQNKETIARIYWDNTLSAPEISITNENTIEHKVDLLEQKTARLSTDSMTTMMALIQVSNLIPPRI